MRIATILAKLVDGGITDPAVWRRLTVRQINAVYFHERDDNGNVLPQIDGPSYDAITAHDSTVVRVMQDKGVSQDAAERLVYEAQQIMQLRARLNAEQKGDVARQPDGTMVPVHVSGPTDEEIDRQAEELQRKLMAERR